MAEAEVVLVSEESLHDKIYNIRGYKVMLDVDLADIYGYETKSFNRQVKNNYPKFEGDDFMFQLTDNELEEAGMSSIIHLFLPSKASIC